MLTKIIKGILLATIFIVPLFYLPFTQEQFQFNKEIVFLLLTLVSGLMWLGSAVRKGKLEIIRTPLDVPLLLVVLAYGLATIVSSNWVLSLINVRGFGLPSFITLVSLVLFYFISVNVFVPEDPKHAKTRVVNTFLGTLLLSAFVAQVVFYLSTFNIHFLPGGHKSFNTLGSSSGLAVFVALLIPVALYFLLRKEKGSGAFSAFSTIVSGVFIVIALLTLNSVNFTLGWWIAATGTFIFLVLFTAYYNQLSYRISLAWISAAVLALALIAIVLKPNSLLFVFAPPALQPQIPAEISLSKPLSRQIALGSSLQDPITFLSGKGPGNFVEVFSKERPQEFNANILWQSRFNRAGNFVYEAIATIGWLGTITFVLLFIFFVATGGFLLMKMRVGDKNPSAFPTKAFGMSDGAQSNIGTKEPIPFTFTLITLLSFFGAIMVSLWLGVPTFSVWMMLIVTFVLVSLIGIMHSPKDFDTIEFTFKGPARNALFLSFGTVFVFVLLLFLTVHIARLYMGEYYFGQALAKVQSGESGENLDAGSTLIARAINLNQNRGVYYLTDAQINIARLRAEIQAIGVENIDANAARVWLASAINQSKNAVDLEPSSVTMWENRGLIFESVSQFTNQARIHAINSFTEATQLEPTNPFLFYKLGQNQRLLWRETQNVAGSEGEEEGAFDLTLIQEAKDNVSRAVELKPDYLPPRMLLARIAEEEGDIPNALGHLRAAIQYPVNQNNEELLYETSRILYNQAAQVEFENLDTLREIAIYLNRVILNSPNHSNSLYTRSLVARQLDDLNTALSDMQRVLELNPDNTDVASKVNEIERELRFVGPSAPPEVVTEIEETNEE